MERHVCLDLAADRGRRELCAVRHDHLDHLLLSRRRRAIAKASGSERRSEPVQRRANLIKVANTSRIEARDRHAALASVDEQTAAFQNLQRMADRLSRHAEH